jgi:hypothetical protein
MYVYDPPVNLIFRDALLVAHTLSDNDPVRALAAATALEVARQSACVRINDSLRFSDIMLTHAIRGMFRYFDIWVIAGHSQNFVDYIAHKAQTDPMFWQFFTNPLRRNENKEIISVANLGPVGPAYFPIILVDLIQIPNFAELPAELQHNVLRTIVDFSCRGRYTAPSALAQYPPN